MKTGGSESTFCAQIADRSGYGNLVQAGTVGVGNPDAFALWRGADEFSEMGKQGSPFRRPSQAENRGLQTSIDLKGYFVIAR